MNEQQFKDRTKLVAMRIIRVVGALPSTKTADVIGRQLLRSGTSVGANYRAACRGKSAADVIAKLAIVEEEADESMYWLELLIESQLLGLRADASDLNPVPVLINKALIEIPPKFAGRPPVNPESRGAGIARSRTRKSSEAASLAGDEAPNSHECGYKG